MPVHAKVDVVTVGGGLTAAILAWKLTAAGLRVVSLEQGPSRWANPDFEMDHDPLRYHVRHAMMVNLSKEAWSWRPNPKAPTLPLRQYGSFNPGTGLGGAMVHWSAMLWRYLPTDFNYRTHYTEKYGKDILPQGNRIQDWPLTYDELEPYYTATEYDIGASGQAGNLDGHILPGGNPFEGPRSKPFPLPPLEVTIPSDMFAKACTELGYRPFTQPAGITSQAFRDPFGNYRSGCLYCGFCTRYGCEVDAKTSAQTTWLPVALHTGRYEVRVNAHVTRIDLGGNGLARGVTYVDADGQEHEQPADLVLVTGFTFANVKTLLVSRGPAHPNGIGNDRGLVGKNYTYQNWHGIATGVFPGHSFNLYMGNTATIKVIYEFNADDFDHRGLGFVGGASIFGVTGERDPLTSTDTYPIQQGKKMWGQDWKEALRQHWNGTAGLTMQGESLPYDDQFLDLDPVYKDAWGMPLLRITFDWHDNDYKMNRFIRGKAAEIMRRMGPAFMDPKLELMPYDIHQYKSTHPTGGAIMGTDPGNSVASKYGQVWDTPNVFVTGACLFPQNPGANPTGTVLALTYLAGDAIRDKYLKNPGQVIG